MYSQAQKFLAPKIVEKLFLKSGDISKSDKTLVLSLLKWAQKKETELIQRNLERNPDFESFYRQKIALLKRKALKKVEERDVEDDTIILDF